MNDLDEIKSISMEMREIFERILQDSIKTRNTHGSCLYGSIILSLSLNQFTTGKAIVCGGGPDEGDGCGLKDKDGQLHGHYWVECTTFDGDVYIVDITADQFGYPPVMFLSQEEAKDKYFPGDPELIKRHVEEEMEACKQASEVHC